MRSVLRRRSEPGVAQGKMNILLIAEESAGIRALTEITRLPYNVVAVMATEPSDHTDKSCVWNAAKTLGYETWPATLVKDAQLAQRILKAKVDVILNVHSLHIIHKEVLSAATIGSFNLHPGPLPRYAGLNAPSWAIYHGEKKHAVTLHKMEPGIDTGAIVFEEVFDITENDTGLSVALRCVQLGVPLLLKMLDIAFRNPKAIPHRPQELGQRTYFGREVPQKGRILWERPARQVFDFIRACDYGPFPSPWGRPQSTYQGRQVSVTKCALSETKSKELAGSIIRDEKGDFYAACSDEWLQIKKMFAAERSMSPAECLSEGGQFEVS